MSPSFSSGRLLVLVVSPWIVGCAGTLVDPLEREKDVLAMNRPGRWQAQGEDDAGHQWQGYLVIEQAPNSFMTKGFFEWTCHRDGKTAGGRYQFEGAYDPNTRTVRWAGFTVQDRLGRVCNAHYEATLSPDGYKLVNGAWHGGIGIPGKWNAEFLGELQCVEPARSAPMIRR